VNALETIVDRLTDCVDVDPQRRHGIPVLRGTRFKVAQVFAQIAADDSTSGLVANFELPRDELERLFNGMARIFDCCAAMTSEDRPAPAQPLCTGVQRLRKLVDGTQCLMNCYERLPELGGLDVFLHCAEGVVSMRNVLADFDSQAATTTSLTQQLAEATQHVTDFLKVCDGGASHSDGAYKDARWKIGEYMDSLIPAAPAEAGKQQEDGQ
jgi:uncharacterized protein (DUF433 family)